MILKFLLVVVISILLLYNSLLPLYLSSEIFNISVVYYCYSLLFSPYKSFFFLFVFTSFARSNSTFRNKEIWS